MALYREEAVEQGGRIGRVEDRIETLEAGGGSGGGGQVNTVVGGTNVTVDSSDPVNPVVSSTDTIFDATDINSSILTLEGESHTHSNKTVLDGLSQGAAVPDAAGTTIAALKDEVNVLIVALRSAGIIAT